MEMNGSRYFKRNFSLGIANGILVNFGMAFIEPFTVLPVFITRLGGSSFLVGLVSALHGAGWFLPQVFVSRIVEAKRLVLNIYRKTAVLRILCWTGVTLTVFFVDPARSVLFIFLFITCFLLANIGAGISAIPFLEICSKTIPITHRGRFFGTRRFAGGVLGVLAGVLVGVILSEHSAKAESLGWISESVGVLADRMGLVGHAFPANYGILFLAGGLLISLGLVMFCFVGEIPADRVQEPRRLPEHLFLGFSLLREERNYLLFFLVRICWQFTAMAFPFYSTYAYEELGFSENAVGVFVSLWVGSSVLSNYVWGRVLDRKGNKLVFIVTAALSLIPPGVVLLIHHSMGPGSAWDSSLLVFGMIASTFLINGFIYSGRFISNITYLLEAAPIEKRPLYVGFMNSFTFPLMLSPALGGIILHFFGVTILFGLCVGFAAGNLLLSARLREPRLSNL